MKYWAYINDEVAGPFEKEELAKLPQFSNSLLICPQSPVGEKTQDWHEAATFPEISALISETNTILNTGSSASEMPSFGEIEIKNIDNLPNENNPEFKSPIDPISLSQIAKRQTNINENQAKSGLQEIDLSDKNEKANTENEPKPFPSQEELKEPIKENINEKKEESSIMEEIPELKIKQEEKTETHIEKNDLKTENLTENQNNDIKPLDISNIEIPKIDIDIPNPEDFNNLSQNNISSNNLNDHDLLNLIQKFSTNSASKEDISLLKSYLDSKLEIMGNKIDSMDISALTQSIKNIEDKINLIENKISQIGKSNIEAPLNKSTLEIEKNYDINVIENSKPTASLSPSTISNNTPAPKIENIAPKTETEKTNQGNLAKNEKSIFKNKFLKIGLLTLSALLLIAITIFVLQKTHIVDLSPYFPFMAQKENKENKEQIALNQNENKTTDRLQTSSNSITQIPIKPDISPEVIDFVKKYAINDNTVEGKIYEFIKNNNLNPDSLNWSAKQIDEDNYQVYAVVNDASGKEFKFDFSLNYKDKVLSFSNELSINLQKKEIKKKAKPKAKKNKINLVKNAKTEMPSNAQVKKNEEAKKTNENQKTENKDEYVQYVEEDEGKQEYLMPGIPKQ